MACPSARVPNHWADDLRPPTPEHTDVVNFLSLTKEDKQKVPWQYYGYPASAKHMASQHDFFVLQRFAPTQVRCLLYLQNEIAGLERALEAWDDYAKKQPVEKGDCGCMGNDEFPERTVIIQKLLPLLQQYNELVNSFAQIRARPTAQKHHLRNLKNWFVTYPDAIADTEQHFTGREGDLFPLVARPKTPLMLLLERWHWLRMRFKTGKRSDHNDSPQAHYWSDKGLETFTTVVILVVGVGMLFGPV